VYSSFSVAPKVTSCRPEPPRRKIPRLFKDLKPAKHFNPRTFFSGTDLEGLFTKRPGTISKHGSGHGREGGGAIYVSPSHPWRPSRDLLIFKLVRRMASARVFAQ